MSNSFREISFWLMDALKGKHIKNHYNDINFILENYNTEASKTARENRLLNLLNHACKTTPFYKDVSNFKSIKDFPVINKNIIRNNYNDFKSEDYIHKKNTPVVTSGSTGTPFKLFHNKNKRLRNTADVIYFAKQAGYQLGTKLYYMKVWNDINRKSKFQMWKENIVPYSIHNYTDDDFKMFISKIKADRNDKNLVGFASTFELLCKYMDKTKAEPLKSNNIKSIIANSEALTSYAKNTMEHYFECPTLSRYSNMENGMLAQQSRTGGEEFHINWASFYIEILNLDNDEPAKYGEYGRVVITDLFNYCMPIIRYDNGDIAMMSENPKGKELAPVISQINGRKVDTIFDTNNNTITSHIVTVNMWKYDELKQYQFIQVGEKDYIFKLNPIAKFTKENEILSEFKGYLGKDANITIEYVDDIPLLSSGKRKLVVNDYSFSNP
ncbi:phenylacetate--CoA ligase family protein [Formosa haliotis]|uniref:phenylacetate--CoA ligase family protein n=1 Tax=Formosa haliotis TaxID=1555194 RepID=UPI0008260695|nr:phenylacetate--CoA ligase family protein [Formosa haliotis]